jgi:hypothetical protein
MKLERLTARSPKNNMAYLVKVKPNEQDVESPYPNTLKCIMEALERLAQYEEAFQNTGEISDGYHTFNELYYQRMILFAVICNAYKEKAWKSKLHADGTMYADYFIVGIETKEGQYTYHYPLESWLFFDVKELDNAPEWDGHTANDVGRLLSLV